LNDRISSLRRVGRSAYNWYDRDHRYGRYRNGNEPALVFYDRPNYRGGSLIVTSGSNTDIERPGSVRVDGGVWRVCDNRGECVIVDRDVANIADLGLSRRLTSVEEVGTSEDGYRP